LAEYSGNVLELLETFPMNDSLNATRPLSRKEASGYLLSRHGIARAPATLAKLATIGGGPVFRKVNSRLAVYNPSDLDAWAASIMSGPMRSTSEAA
jgi:hypothetical protein